MTDAETELKILQTERHADAEYIGFLEAEILRLRSAIMDVLMFAKQHWKLSDEATEALERALRERE